MYSSMRLGVPFIAPRQLGAVESILGRQFLPSVAWCTGQSGADFLPYLAKPTVNSLGAIGAPDTVWCTPDSPVPPFDRWLGHASHAGYAADRWPGQPLAHRTVRCTTGHCPVQISFLFWRSRPLAIWSRWRTGHCPVPPSDRWAGHASRADCTADRWLGRPLAHQTVR